MLFQLARTQLFSQQTEKSLYLLQGFAEMGLKGLLGEMACSEFQRNSHTKVWGSAVALVCFASSLQNLPSVKRKLVRLTLSLQSYQVICNGSGVLARTCPS